MNPRSQPVSLWCSRMYCNKRKADADATILRRHGGKYVRVTGSRGVWRVRSKISVADFAGFCVWEASRESSM